MSLRWTSRAGVVVAAVALAATGAVSPANAASRRDVALSKSIRAALADASAPGAIVGVWQQGRAPYVRTFGVRDTATREPMRANLFMRIGSETKTFTITALLQLVDQGKVSLDDPISKYVDGVVSGDAITLRDLAVMRSGLVNYSVVPAFDQLLTADPHKAWTPQELLSYSITTPLQFAPNAGFQYSNTNTILLGLVVEKASGESIEQYIKQHITDPIGMTQTSFPTDSALPAPHAQGYSTGADKSVADATGWNPTWTWSAGQMVSTLRDLHIWAPRLATGRGLLSAKTQAVRAASVAKVQEPITYGLGLFNVHGWIGHNGSLPGYQTIALYRPQTRTTVVALINTDVAAHGYAPSTLVGKAITSVISPKNLYTLPAAPSGEDE
jgi:D-alanyl-D-alanine carboxypeptidase